jgi:tight adherence protein B
VSDFDELAGTVQRLAVLMGAGIPPTAAWGYLGERAGGVAERVRDGVELSEAIALESERSAGALASGWRALAAAWSVGTRAGAPLGPTLRDVADALRALAAADRAVELALTAPKATARIVLVLPVVGLLLGILLGFDTVGVLVGSSVGIGCLVAGVALMLVAWRWNRALVRRATPTDAAPGIACDLTAIAVSGGLPAAPAHALARSALERHGFEDDPAVDDVLTLAERAGVPAVELLRGSAAEARALAAAAAQRAAERLGVTLMLPLGVCVLPAFILLGVAPLVIAVVTSAVAVF